MNSNSLTFSNDNLRSRLASEKRFKFYGIIAIILALSFVLILFTNIISKGYSAFYRTLISIDINLSEGFDVSELSVMTDKEIYVLDFYSFTKKSIYKNFPQLEKKSDKYDEPIFR